MSSRERLKRLIGVAKRVQNALCAEHCHGRRHSDLQCREFLAEIALAEGKEAEPCISCGEPVFGEQCECQDAEAQGRSLAV